jgi:sugar lactone lactonase YvrE
MRRSLLACLLLLAVPATAGATEWDDFPVSPDHVPIAVAADGDGVWVAERPLLPLFAPRIAHVTPDGQVGTTFAVGQPGDGAPAAIAVAPDGSVWFTVPAGDVVGRWTAAGGIDAFPLPGGSEPFGIAPGPGNRMWITLQGTTRLASVPVAAAEGTAPTVVTSPVTGGAVPRDIVADDNFRL